MQSSIGYRSYQARNSLREKCGIVGLYTRNLANNLSLALLAASGVQHRGQQGAGLALKTKSDLKIFKNTGLLKEIFTDEVISNLDRPCQWVLIHCRYGTHGDYQPRNLQPCIAYSSKQEPIAVVHNGEFVALENLTKQADLDLESGLSDTYIFTQALSLAKGQNWDKRIANFLEKIKGAFGLIIGVGDSLYVARDRMGIRPLVLGAIDDGFIIASETHALNKAGAKLIRDIRKGEIVRINRQGVIVLKSGSKSQHHFCDFEWAYFSRPDSIYPTYEKKEDESPPKKWLSFASFREKCGQTLAKEVEISNANFVVGVPDSGIAVAMGYANAANLPYRQLIIRDHFDPNGLQRLFMRDDQIRDIGGKVLEKLSLVPDSKVWRDAIVVVGDDSIIRGNVSGRISKAIFSLGAKEVHWIVGFPPVAYPCHLGVSMRSKEELIAARLKKDPKKIAKAIGATSVNYISRKGFIQARKHSIRAKINEKSKEIFLQSGGCGGCITGIYPVSIAGQLWRQKKLRLAVLIGNGSRLPAVYQYVKQNNNIYKISVVVSYKAESAKIEWARKRGMPSVYHRWISYKRSGKSREEYNQDLVDLLNGYGVDFVFGIGWDIIWTPNFLKAFPDRVLNAHPFPLPDGPVKTISYKSKKIPVLRGMNALRRAYDKKLPITGACVHFARETVDIGPVLVRDILPIRKKESFEELEERHCLFEGKLLVRALKLLAKNEVEIVNDRVKLVPKNN